MDFLIVLALAAQAHFEMDSASAQQKLLVPPGRSQRNDMGLYQSYLSRYVDLHGKYNARMGVLTGVAMAYRLDPARFIVALKYGPEEGSYANVQAFSPQEEA